MRGGWGITFRDNFVIPLISSARYTLSSRTGSLPRLAFGPYQTFCPALHRPTTDSAVYAKVTETFVTIYHCFLPQPLGTRPGARPE
jgi:hypothetical protein